MVDVIAIGGEPATGKTTLIEEQISAWGPSKEFDFGMVKGHLFEEDDVWLLGLYGNSRSEFKGTDALAMNVIEDAKRFIKQVKDQDRTIVFEGDRLFGDAFFSFLDEQDVPFDIYVLTCPDRILEVRHQQRADDQSENWLKGRRTKVENIIEGWPVTVLENKYETDLSDNREVIFG